MSWKVPDNIDWNKADGCWVYPMILLAGYLLFRLFI
jgi:hypothetical protein